MNKYSKLQSGRYFLALCTGFILVTLTIAIFRVIWLTAGVDDPQVHPIVLSTLTAVLSSITAVIGFYFGQKAGEAKPKE